MKMTATTSTDITSQVPGTEQSAGRISGEVVAVGDLVRLPGGRYSIEFSLRTSADPKSTFVAEDYVALGVEAIVYRKDRVEVEVDDTASEAGQPARVTYVKNITTDEEVCAADAAKAID
jgi:hypothetical protein